MVRILHGTELSLEQDLLALLERAMQISRGVADIRLDHIAVLQKRLHQRVGIHRRLVVKVLEHDVLEGADLLRPLPENLRVKKLADLETDLGVLVRVKRRDAGLRGAKRPAAESLLFILVKQRVVRHQHVRAVRHQKVRFGHSLAGQRLEFIDQVRYIESNAVADDIRDVIIKNARGQQMKREAAIVIDDRVAGVGAALETDDDIRLHGKHVGDLAFSLVAPVSSYNCSNHCMLPPTRLLKTISGP